MRLNRYYDVVFSHTDCCLYNGSYSLHFYMPHIKGGLT